MILFDSIMTRGYGDATFAVSKILNELNLEERKEVEEFLKRVNEYAYIEYKEKLKKDEEFYLNPNFEEDLEKKIKTDLASFLEKGDFEHYEKMKRIFGRCKPSMIETSKEFKKQHELDQKNTKKHSADEIYNYKKELFIELSLSGIHRYDYNDFEDFL
ncbi:MAG: hypothetical protein Q4P18_07755 [Methanobrevibacter sp.]|uniref:hypothetical protein n=1 Tax=Methanobrevibacter sp. TaxID=66852 RepID=UPI0026E022B8|nr:hypothetical protein [Methanobrevibacter sp.]MDO5849414.1 hypothetical protein [Methanobrevibacter sp.]